MFDPPSPLVTVISPKPLDWAAFQDGQDGDKGWQQLDSTKDTIRFEPRSDRFSLAFVCQDAQLGEIIHARAHEIRMVRAPCGSPLGQLQGGVPPPRHTWRGSIKGAVPGSRVTVVFGTYHVSFPATVMAAGYATELSTGAYDLLALEQPPAGPARLIVIRGIRVAAAGGTDVDFEQGALLTEDRPWTAVALPGESLEAGLTLTTFGAGASLSFSSMRPGHVPVLVPSALHPQDAQELWISGVQTQPLQMRGLIQTFAGGALAQAELPPLFSSAGAVLASRDPVARPRVSFDPEQTGQPAGPEARPGVVLYQMTVSTAASAGLTWVVNASARWLAGKSSFEMANLAAVPGFDSSLGPPRRRSAAAGTDLGGQQPTPRMGPRWQLPAATETGDDLCQEGCHLAAGRPVIGT